jgi:hypothetical protein
MAHLAHPLDPPLLLATYRLDVHVMEMEWSWLFGFLLKW